MENQITEIAGEIILKEIDQVLRSKELELSQVEIEVQSLRIVAELLGEEADQRLAQQRASNLSSKNMRKKRLLHGQQKPWLKDPRKGFGEK